MSLDAHLNPPEETEDLDCDSCGTVGGCRCDEAEDERTGN
jgi:hypothetical protein